MNQSLFILSILSILLISLLALQAALGVSSGALKPQRLQRILAVNSSPVLFLKLLHERDERLDAFARKSVVDGGAYAADRAGALQAGQAGGGRPLGGLLFQLLPRQ